MRTISLKSFAETGKFGNIEIGSLKTDVIKELGPQFDHSIGNETEIIKYGWFEFYFWCDSGKLFGIQNDHLHGNSNNHEDRILFKNNYFEIDAWFLKVNKDFNYKEVIKILEIENVKYLELSSENEAEKIEFQSGCYFDFNEGFFEWNAETNENHEIIIENKAEYLLNGIRIFDFRAK